MSGICFVTDVRPGEKDILNPVRLEPLHIFGLNDELIDTIQPPVDGWTHAALLAQAESLAPRITQGACAYLGSQWVGSTEV